MKEMEVESEQNNCGNRHEVGFIVICAFGGLCAFAFYYYIMFYVDGVLFQKYAVCASMFTLIGCVIFFGVIMVIFYVAVQIQFTFLNNYFRFGFFVFS